MRVRLIGRSSPINGRFSRGLIENHYCLTAAIAAVFLDFTLVFSASKLRPTRQTASAPNCREVGGYVPQVSTTVPEFDIFLGSCENNALWLESVGGLDAAVQRMHEIAGRRPGMYFVLNLRDRVIVAKTDTRPDK